MGIDSKHPLYLARENDWRKSRDTYGGEDTVKEEATKYLPATSGMIADGFGSTSTANTPGAKAYLAYLTRAVFPELLKEGVESMLGVMHHKPPTIMLPAKMEPMRERATMRNESLEMLLRRMNEEQLIAGRLGLLVDVVQVDGKPVAYLSLYKAEDVINWDEGTSDDGEPDKLTLVVIDETQEERGKDFEWNEVKKHRVLILGSIDGEGESTTYRAGVFREDNNFNDSGLSEPSVSGKTLDRIPFVFANTKDVVPTPDAPPLIGLSNLSLTIYRGEADYRQALFMQGQDTLVTIGTQGGEDAATRVGAGAEISLPLGGDAKYIGPDSQGIPEMRSALENDYTRGKEKATSLLEAVGRGAESGEALRVRVAARTASLNQIAMAGAFALQEALRIAAEWLGLNPDEVEVEPNLDFVSDTLDGQQLVHYLAAKGLGAPMSLESIHALMRSKGLTEKTWDEELEQMQKEAAEGLAADPTANDEGATDDGSPEDDPEGDEGEDDGSDDGFGKSDEDEDEGGDDDK